MYITFGLVILISLILGIKCSAPDRYRNGSSWDFFPIIPFVAVGSLIAVFAALMIPLGFTLAVDKVTPEKPNEVLYLQAIEMGNETRGRFFLGIGRFDGESIYKFYVKDGVGYYPDEIDADQTYIIEDTATPRIEVYVEHQPTWIIPAWFDETNEWDKKYVIHVPPGSIKENIDMELK